MSEFGDRLSEARELVDWLAVRLENLAVTTTRSQHIAAACFQVSLRHHAAIVTLVERNNVTAAAALLRPQIEAYLRGAWIQFSASPDQIRRFMAKGVTAEIAVGDLEKADAFDSGKLTEIKRLLWSPLSDFTHCGGRMIEQHFSGDDLVPSFSPKVIFGLLNDSNLWALTAANSFCLLAEWHDGAIEMLAKLKSLKSNAP